MTVQDVMTADPETCVPSDNCIDAGRIMRRRHCGFVPVVDTHAARHLVGVVTDRDIALYLTSVDQAPSDITVGQCMTRDAKTVAPSATMEEAARVMESAAVHRLPVVHEGRLVGVLSLKDLARTARRQWASAGLHVIERQMTDILEAISAVQ